MNAHQLGRMITQVLTMFSLVHMWKVFLLNWWFSWNQ